MRWRPVAARAARPRPGAGQEVAQRGPERAGQDVGQPKRQHRIEFHAVVQGGDRADHCGHQQRGGQIAQPELLGDQVAGGGTQREGEQDRQPGEPFAAPRVDAVDGQGLLHWVPPGERHRQGEGEDDGGGVQRDPEVCRRGCR